MERELKEKELLNALTDVRRAYRLLYAYQTKILDLVNYIKASFDFTELSGNKHFSNALRGRKNSHCAFSLFKGMWAWDLIYSYVFEFYLGSKVVNKYQVYFSVVSYPDTGYFDTLGINRTETGRFSPAEASGSKFLFILELKPARLKYPMCDDYKEIIYTKEYASKEHGRNIIEGDEGRKVILCSYPMEKFLDESVTRETLADFSGYVKQQSGIELLSPEE